MTHIRPQKPSGFTLIEVSIVVLIVSLIAAGLLNVSTGLKETEKMVDSHKSLERIEKAIEDFYANNDYWPCPASLTAPEGSALFAVSADCNVAEGVDISDTGTVRVGVEGGRVRIGAVPIYNLGLPLQYYRDKWHSRILYAVTEKLTKDNADFSENSGRVSIVSEDGITSVTGENKAGWILVSHGQDFKGSYSDQGTLRKDCGTSANLDVENCDHVNILTADNIFRQARFNKGTVENKFFDDLIAWGMPVSPSEAKTTKLMVRFTTAWDNVNWGEKGNGAMSYVWNERYYNPGTFCADNIGDGYAFCKKAELESHIANQTIIPPLDVKSGWIFNDSAPKHRKNCNGTIGVTSFGYSMYASSEESIFAPFKEGTTDWHSEDSFNDETASIVKVVNATDGLQWIVEDGVSCKGTKGGYHYVACCKEFRE